ncbi:MAG: IS1182 family transposase [Acidobacteriota bacterium]
MLGKHDPNVELLDAQAHCRKLVPDGSVYALLADHRSVVFPDELFSDLFPSNRGRPSVPVQVIASAMLLKELENLSDREAADALRCDIRWKVATGLALDDPGVHYTVFTYYRTRLNNSQRPKRINEAVRQIINETGVLKGKKRRALDSTLLDDAVATQDTVTQLVSAIRKVRRLIPEAARVEVSAHDYDASGKPVCAWDDPQAKQDLVSGLVNDANRITAVVEGKELNDEQDDALGLLALVAGQDVEPGETEGSWKIAQAVAPDRTISTVDTESRHMHKSRSVYRDGYKAHLAVEPETGIITDSSLTAASAADGPNGVALLKGEEPGLTVIADSAYGSADTRSKLAEAKHHQAIKPLPLRMAVPGGFDRDDFIVDHRAGTVVCPAEHKVQINTKGRASFQKHCRGCPLIERCTTSKRGRVILIGENDELMVQARKEWKDQTVAEDYRQYRPMVERSISWLVANGHRRVRYRGINKNELGLSLRVAALNLRRLVNLGLDHNGAWILPA